MSIPAYFAELLPLFTTRQTTGNSSRPALALTPRPEAFGAPERRFRGLTATTPQRVKSLRRLAELVAGKAAFLRDMVKNALAIDAKSQSEGLSSTQIIKQYQDFKCNTPHAISPDEFADIYAETIAYGLLAARLDDEYPNTFLRSQALDLFPKSNPFLRELFAYIAGPSLDDRLRSAIDDICDLFQSTDMLTILRNPCEIRGQQDPFLHFCEAFLAKYNPARRKSRGVWHTPKPVVSFIVRSVDELLKNEFGLPDGLADASMIESDPDLGECANRMQPILTSQSNHRVQILDPATGPGTFLAEVMEFIAERVKDSAPEQWASYIDNDLIPRIHGYELLVASYAMCHIKLQMTLAGLGYKPSNNPPPYRVYLTNTLENGENVVQTMFGLSHTIPRDARIMSEIERKTPILCVIGNPPYSGESENNGHWIMDLMECYKKEPGGLQKLQERNSKWINDDYVKFIRFAEHMIATTGEGILGFVTNHGYLDNPTFRGMRWHLMNCFDRIYLLDLHGNSKKKEVSPNGSPDKNLFDISQGVAIIVAVKRRRANGTEKPLAELRYGELWGTREQKFEALARGTISTLAEAVLPPNAPQFPFVARNFSAETEYEKGFSVVDLMPTNSVGIVTARDDLTIDMDRDALWARVQDFYETDVETLRTRYNLGKDARDWSVERAKADVIANYSRSNLTQVAYRPFDHRWTYHTGNQRGFQSYPRVEVMRHFTTPLAKPSASGTIGLVFTRTVEGSRSFADVIVQNIPITLHYLSIKEGNYIAPLHLFPQDGDIDQTTRVNMDPALFEQIRVAAGLAAPFSRDRSMICGWNSGDSRSDEIKVFDYIYGILHCPEYRKTHAELLKTAFPRVPFPANPGVFSRVSAQGESLRRLHLMEDSAVGIAQYPFEGEGHCVVVKPRFVDGCVWINASQYFAGVPLVAWEFPIGGYLPAQRWLKDRKGRVLGSGDVRHYSRIIRVLAETCRIMHEIRLA